MNLQQKLIDKYSNQSKHSNYQALPAKLQQIIPNSSVVTNSRWEQERLEYIKSRISIKGMTVLDIGGNTGFFTFEILDAEAAKIFYYDGNKDHADFVELAAEALNLQGRINVNPKYFDFSKPGNQKYDIGLLLNVLHHTGSDYGEKNSEVNEAKEAIINQLNSMSQFANVLIFQLGFNWHGDPAKPLFTNGTKEEMISYIKNGTRNHWDIESIGIAQKTDAGVTYEALSENNIDRDDSVGEFLNRPLFILKARSGEKG